MNAEDIAEKYARQFFENEDHSVLYGLFLSAILESSRGLIEAGDHMADVSTERRRLIWNEAKLRLCRS